VRQDLLDRGTAPEIPTKRSRKMQYMVDKRLYALRARIECFFNKLKNHRHIATRYDRTSTSFLGFVLLGCIRIWIRFVHAA
jgi:transposase